MTRQAVLTVVTAVMTGRRDRADVKVQELAGPFDRGALGAPVSKSPKPVAPRERNLNTQNGALGAPFPNTYAYAIGQIHDEKTTLHIKGFERSAPSAPLREWAGAPGGNLPD